MNEPLVSWHCVTYDRPDYLKELLFFFISQTYKNKELIIINDQKTIKYSCSHPNVKIYNLDERFKSLGAKRNFAMSKCSGDYIHIADDDDVYFSEHTEHLLYYHEINKECDIMKDRFTEYSVNGRVVEKLASTVGFSRCSIKKEYLEKKQFNEDLNCYEDADYVDGANMGIIENDEAFNQYRWGMNVKHMSSFGDFDKFDINKQKDMWNIIKNEEKNTSFQEIKLIPHLFYFDIKDYR